MHILYTISYIIHTILHHVIGEDLVDTDDDEEGGLTDLSYATETSFIQVYIHISFW